MDDSETILDVKIRMSSIDDLLDKGGVVRLFSREEAEVFEEEDGGRSLGGFLVGII